jgi:hypothetical protein
MNNKPVDQIPIPPETVQKIVPFIYKALKRIKKEEAKKEVG